MIPRQKFSKSEIHTEEISKDWIDYDFGDDESEIEEDSENILMKSGTQIFSGVKKMGAIGKSMTSMANIKKMGNLGDNLMGGLKNMGDRLKNLINENEMDDDNNNFGSASDYKSKFLSKYGVSFTIPSMYVQSSAWYPADTTFFVQIINTVVPSSDDEYQVHTHLWEKNRPAQVQSFEEIFKDNIKGCTVRLIRTDKDLNSMTVLSSYVFDQFPRIDKMKAEFSIDGKYLVLYSNANRFIKVYEINRIENIISDI